MKWRITSISLTSGKPSIGVARESGPSAFGGINGGHVERRKFHAALAGRGLFEDQAFVLADVARGFAYVFGGRFEIGEFRIQILTAP